MPGVHNGQAGLQAKAAGVDALLVKGAALALTVYPEPAARPMTDIDLLVREAAHEGVEVISSCEAHPALKAPSSHPCSRSAAEFLLTRRDKSPPP